MPPTDSAASIVARFLKANHYSESYDAFIAEAGLPESAGTLSKGDLTLETLLEEKRTYDVATRFEKLGLGGESEMGWIVPAPKRPEIVKSLPTSSNILSTTVATLRINDSENNYLMATTADRRLHIISLPSLALHASYSALVDAPMLSCVSYTSSVLLVTTMSGALLAIDTNGSVLDKRKDHTKYVVTSASSHDKRLVATAGWDNKVIIYRPSSPTDPDGTHFSFGEPCATVTLPTKPESLLFFTHPDTNEPILLLSRTDSSSLHYYAMPALSSDTGSSATTKAEPILLGRQNLAPHSNAWVAFTPSALAPHPTDPTLLAVGTNSIPHMKVLIIRLFVPPSSTTASPSAPNQEPAPPHLTQTTQARAALRIADREDAAILVHANTTAQQTAYSTPCVAWRPDGSGVWVNGDDGVVRGVETKTGKVVVGLGGEEGHEAGSKVRCLGAGRLQGRGGEGAEVMVSGGFDQRLIVWRCE